MTNNRSDVQPAQPGQHCTFCDTTDFVFVFQNRLLCKTCFWAIYEILQSRCPAYLSEPVDALGYGRKDCRFVREDGPWFRLYLRPIDVCNTALEQECQETFGNYEIPSFQAAQKFLAGQGFPDLVFTPMTKDVKNGQGVSEKT